MTQTAEKINPICTDCQKLGKDCNGTTCQVWTGCVYYQKDESPEAKQRRIFQHYKEDLKRLASRTNPDALRFLAVQYVCSFPNIDPYKMAVSLAKDGFQIIFDNSANSTGQNKAEKRKFSHLLTVEG